MNVETIVIGVLIIAAIALVASRIVRRYQAKRLLSFNYMEDHTTFHQANVVERNLDLLPSYDKMLLRGTLKHQLDMDRDYQGQLTKSAQSQIDSRHVVWLAFLDEIERSIDGAGTSRVLY